MDGFVCASGANGRQADGPPDRSPHDRTDDRPAPPPDTIRVSDPDDLAPIALRDNRLRGDRYARPWTWRLTLLLRALAVLELAKGLYHWALLLGLGPTPFPDGPLVQRIGAVVFAVADPVAAVGLWLAAAWGVVIWLCAASAQLMFSALVPSSALNLAVTPVWALAMAAYLALSLKAKREED